MQTPQPKLSSPGQGPLLGGSAGTQTPGRDWVSWGGQCWGWACACTLELGVPLQQSPETKALEGERRAAG